MTLSAAFTVDSVANPASHTTTYGATVTLQRTSLQGAASWSIDSVSKSDMVAPTITVAAGGNSATFQMVADPGDKIGRSLLATCTVTDGRNTVTETAVVGVVNDAGYLPICPGELTARNSTAGWGDDVNAQLSAIGVRSDWTNYTPTLGAAGGSPAIGDGQINGYYRIEGDSIELNVYIYVGSTTNLGTGEIRIGLPGLYHIDGGKLPDGSHVPGVAWLRDSSTATNNTSGYLASANADAALAVYPNGTASVMASNAPFTFATGDSILLSATFPWTLSG